MEGPTHTTVSQVLDAPAERIFAVLRDPRRHPDSTPPADCGTPRPPSRSPPSETPS
ncbi:hypothetical protein [Streptomyces sp. NPDC048663]|uniref:hypothetical protein n=1 Tax=Streptomyces sp. NPDC048663 TaxID=3155638 RepID=UPI0034126045